MIFTTLGGRSRFGATANSFREEIGHANSHHR